MKLGFSSFVAAAVAASAVVGVAADCPDYTSFSQVCCPWFLYLSQGRVGRVFCRVRRVGTESVGCERRNRKATRRRALSPCHTCGAPRSAILSIAALSRYVEQSRLGHSDKIPVPHT